MKMLEVQLPERTVAKLEAAAERLHISLEELLLLSVEEKLAQLDVEFQQATDYVLTKNAELYKRLA
ncbi:MAG: DNA-binding protein [Acidobacteria bacterium]|nr:DNA-binding protein [Acidobacteriota bacterium]